MLAIALVGLVLSFTEIACIYHREFDSEMELRAKFLAKTISRKGDSLSIGIADDDFHRMFAAEKGSYYQVWLSDGSIVAKSKELGRETLPRHTENGEPYFGNLKLSNGIRVRYITIGITPRKALPGESTIGANSCGIPSELNTTGPYIFIGLAQQRQRAGSFLFKFSTARICLLIAIIAAGIFLLDKRLTKALSPLEQLNEQLSQLSPSALDQRIELDIEPVELEKVIAVVNKFIECLDKAFQREKRFVSDVAHELRTPVAEFRLACEVGAQWSDDAELVRRRFEDLRQTAIAMENRVNSLLELRRAERDKVVLTENSVRLRPFIEKSWGKRILVGNPLGLALECSIDDNVAIATDESKLEIIIQNLFGNALSYAPFESLVKVSCKDNGNGFNTITVSNEAPDLKHEDVEHIFDRFWRGQSSNDDGSHSGLGLSIVKLLADALNTQIAVTLSEDGIFSISIKFPPGLDPTVRINRRA